MIAATHKSTNDRRKSALSTKCRLQERKAQDQASKNVYYLWCGSCTIILLGWNLSILRIFLSHWSLESCYSFIHQMKIFWNTVDAYITKTRRYQSFCDLLKVNFLLKKLRFIKGSIQERVLITHLRYKNYPHICFGMK